MTHDTIDEIRIDTDEGRFVLHLTGVEGDRYAFDIHAVAAELLRAVRVEINPWYQEALDAKAAMVRRDPEYLEWLSRHGSDGGEL